MATAFIAELTAALEAARLAAEYVAGEYERFAAIPNAPADISTHADRGAQELILQFLHERFPLDGLCAEENTKSKAPATANRMWVVDPIDGTRGFAVKNGEFSVMIGLTVDGDSVLGVVVEPVTMRYTYASLGEGCWTRSGEGETQRCYVKEERDLANATLVQSHSRPGRPSVPVQVLKPGAVMEMYSAGVKMAVVARGEADLYVNTYGAFSDWDICAGHILVTEAGGVVHGLAGEAITYGRANFKQTAGLVSASQAIDAAVMEGLKGMA